MARFCAYVDIKYANKIEDFKPLDFEQVLINGHRGYISYSEDDLAKAFDKRVEIVRDSYSKLKKEDDQRKLSSPKWHRPREEFVEATMWYEEAVTIADAIFEEKFL